MAHSFFLHIVLSLCVAAGFMWLATMVLGVIGAILEVDLLEERPYCFFSAALQIVVLLSVWIAALAWFEGEWEFVLPFQWRSRIHFP